MNKILSIAFNTFRESVRGKLLYSILFFAILVIIVSSVFGLVTIGNQVKVLKDFGLFALTLFGVAYVVLTGSALLHKELSKKTIYNILSKPVTRTTFLLGKFFGMLLTFTVLMLIMSAGLVCFVYFYEEKIDPLMFIAIYSVFLQISLICSLAILFSSIIVTPFLSGAIVFSMFVIGRSTDFIIDMMKLYESMPSIVYALKAIYFVTPHLDVIDVSNQVVYSLPVDDRYLLWSSVYTIIYCVIALLLATIFFSRREFN